jgi:hypothetical protein
MKKFYCMAMLIVLAACGGNGGGDEDADTTGDPDVITDDAAADPLQDPLPDPAVDPDAEAPDTVPDAFEEEEPPAGLVLGLTDRGFTYNGVETFMLSVSYYGGCGADPAVVRSDLEQLASLRFNNLRLWVTWPTPDVNSAVVRSDGTLDEAALARLKALLEAAQENGMTVDVTFSNGTEGISDGGFDAYRTAMELLAGELLDYRHIFFDLGNERDVGDSRFLSVDEVRDLAAAVRAVDPDRLVTASLGGNPPDAAAAKYIDLYSTADVDFATPHFPRNDEWADQTAERIEAMRAILLDAGWDRPIYLQEEARRGYGDATWPKSDFLTAVAEAAGAGAAGWCFHNDAGFDLSSGSFFDYLDDVELDTIDELADAAGL